jgi:hypothetical protein
MQTLDEMLSRRLLSPEQHSAIGSWIRSARTPEAIQAMPPHLWRVLALASLLLNVDADLQQVPGWEREL